MTQTKQQAHSPFVLAEQAKRAEAFQLRVADKITAFAGVLLVLSLVYFVYLGNNTDFADSTQWIAGAILLAGVLAQSGGFSCISPSASRVAARWAPD
jgi:uncharacterized membrane protein